tara:strand:+ start:10559 stop:10777 length:219 start_codon:yes stop_codon:yes gene_type:complete
MADKLKNKWLVMQLITDKYINSIVIDKHIKCTSSTTVIDARVWTNKDLDELYKIYPLGQEGFHANFTLIEYK